MRKPVLFAAVAVTLLMGCGGSSTSGGNSTTDGDGDKTKHVKSSVKQAAKVEQTYAVTFDANGGTVSPTTGTTDKDGKLASLPAPTRIDYVFNGWYTAEAGNTEVTTSTVFSANATVYAQWKEGFTDNRDGKTYKKTVIGTQTWMGQNLDYDVPGDITDVCYENSPDSCAKYGRLYTWDAAKKACPVGWHLPMDAEWTTLVKYVGDDSTAGKKLKSTSGWYVWNNNTKIGYNGTDDFGFSALPGGSYDGINAGDVGIWWSATKRSNNGDAWSWGTGDFRRVLQGLTRDYYNIVGESTEKMVRHYDNQASQFSVRCVMDGSYMFTDTLTFTDSRDNKVYKKVKIGTQTWMAENLNYAGGTHQGWRSNCYGNDSLICEKYGSLYSWSKAMAACPADWRLPNNEDWTTLINYVGGLKVAGGKLKSKTGWKNNGNGTDDFGFSALPGGYGYSGRFYDDGSYHNISDLGYWWSATVLRNGGGAGKLLMEYENGNVELGDGDGAQLLSVRCIEN